MSTAGFTFAETIDLCVSNPPEISRSKKIKSGLERNGSHMSPAGLVSETTGFLRTRTYRCVLGATTRVETLEKKVTCTRCVELMLERVAVDPPGVT
jgi:hypothetical protein